MLRLDINLVFTIINLLIWYAIIRIFLFKPINKVIDKRSAAIQEKYDEAKKMQEEAQAEKEKYAACQDEIEVEKNKVLDAARASAREEGRQLIENAQKEADKVIRKAGEGILDDFKLAGFHGHVIDPYCRDDDPHDGEETEGSSIESGADRQGDRHPPYGHSYNQSTGKTSDCCNVSLGLADGEHVKEDEQWDCRHAGGNDDAPGGSVFLNPGHDLLLREIMSLYLRAGYPKAFLPLKGKLTVQYRKR